MILSDSIFEALINQSNYDMTNKEAVMAFYKQALTVNNHTSPSEVLNSILSDDFLSCGTVDNKTKDQLIGQLSAFWKMIPDLKWEPQEIIENSNQIIVRSKFSGTPNSPEGHFFGLPTDGSKSFQSMSIDIHTVDNGEIIKVEHVEDWATTLKQLKS